MTRKQIPDSDESRYAIDKCYHMSLPLNYLDDWLKVHAKEFRKMARSTFSDALESFKVAAQILVKVQYNLWPSIMDDQQSLGEVWTNAVNELLHHDWVFTDVPMMVLCFISFYFI
jgi:hypothetical protein